MSLPPKAPPVYKPTPLRLAAPPAYRPNQVNHAEAQLKPANNFRLETRPAPPAYRPYIRLGVQPKTAKSFALETRPAPKPYQPYQQPPGIKDTHNPKLLPNTVCRPKAVEPKSAVLFPRWPNQVSKIQPKTPNQPFFQARNGRATIQCQASFVTRLSLGRSNIIQMERKSIANPGWPFTLEKIENLWAAIQEQITELEGAGEIELSYIDRGRLQTWQNQYQQRIQTLRNLNPGATELTKEQVEAQSNDLERAFRAVLISLNLMRNALNTAFEQYNNYKDSLDISSKYQEELQKYREESETTIVKKYTKESNPNTTTTTSSSSEDFSGVPFPHKGKHAPPRNAVNNPKLLIKETVDGNPALYLTNHTPTVLAWEHEARTNGWTCSDGFTIIYGFNSDIGSDQGEMTRFIRIDGDHGHPIHQSGSKTSFDSYITKDIEKAKGNKSRLGEIAEFLKKVGLDPAAYGL